MIGKQIGNYNILKKLGEGGMGAVFLARDAQLERHVALKVIAPELARNPKLMARFRVEAIAQAKLNHNNITTIHAFDNQQDVYYIVMEYVEGLTLRDLIRQRGALPQAEALPIFLQILDAIAYAHSRGVIHRDIKPSNIFLTRDGVVKIGDFGIAKVEGVEGLTRVGSTIGSPIYSSPEQVRGEKVDARTDVYSLGMTLYEMLTGRLPFQPPEMSEYRVMKEVLEKTPPPAASFNPAISAGLDAVISASIQKSADQRYQSVQEFKHAVEHPPAVKKRSKSAAPAQSPTDKPTPSSAAPGLAKMFGPLPPERRKQLILLGIILGAVVLALLVYIIIASGSSSMLSDGDHGAPSPPPGPSATENKTASQFPAIVQGKSATAESPPSGPAPGSSPPAGTPSGAPSDDPSPPTPARSITTAPAPSGADFYIAQAKASYYSGNKDNVRKFALKAFQLGAAPSFPVYYHVDKKQKVPGVLKISPQHVSFSPHHSQAPRFAIAASKLKDVYDDSMSDIGGIFKKKKDKDNPAFFIKDTNNTRYKIEISIREGKMRGFIKKIIETVMDSAKKH